MAETNTTQYCKGISLQLKIKKFLKMKCIETSKGFSDALSPAEAVVLFVVF